MKYRSIVIFIACQAATKAKAEQTSYRTETKQIVSIRIAHLLIYVRVFSFISFFSYVLRLFALEFFCVPVMQPRDFKKRFAMH